MGTQNIQSSGPLFSVCVQNSNFYTITLEFNYGKCIVYQTQKTLNCYQIAADTVYDNGTDRHSLSAIFYLSYDHIFQGADIIATLCHQLQDLSQDIYPSISLNEIVVEPLVESAVLRRLFMQAVHSLHLSTEIIIPGVYKNEALHRFEYCQALNSRAMFDISFDYFPFQNKAATHSSTLITTTPAIYNVVEHFTAIKDKDKRRFLFLYFHLCYIASLFRNEKQDFALVIDTTAPMKQFLTEYLFGSVDKYECEKVLASNIFPFENYVELFHSIKDLPFVIEVNDSNSSKKCEQLMQLIYPAGMFPEHTKKYPDAIPVVVSSYPYCCDNILHISLSPDDVELPILPLSMHVDIVKYISGIMRTAESSFVGGLVESVSQLCRSFDANKMIDIISERSSIYTVLQALNEFLHSVYCSLGYVDHQNLFSEPIDIFLNRFIPTLTPTISFTGEKFYQKIRDMSEQGNLHVYSMDKHNRDNCVSEDMLRMQPCLLYTKDS